ncbi:MAG: DUF4270 domain-containing protein [Flavobacteriaceae bacterium]|nr:DUF4270 domain-containing protein [Flavobacteriaceae bacterium]
MKENKKIFQNILLYVILATAFISCDEDFSSVGSGIIGEDNFDTNSQSYSVIAHNQSTGKLRSNSIPLYLLGHYNESTFGSSSASIIGQMQPSDNSYNPIFGDDVVIESVYLNIPYFATALEQDDDGNTTYELDSVLGNESIKLEVYKNEYYLRNFDPNSEFDEALQYYSNQTASDGSMITLPSEGSSLLLYSNDNFEPSAEEIIITEEDEDGEEEITARLTPAIRIPLLYNSDADDDDFNTTISENFWEDLFISKEGEPELSNANNFLNYFRGLYIKASASSTNINGSMATLNLSSASLTITYTNNFDEEDTDNDDILNFADADADGDGVIENGPDTDNDGIKDDYDASITGGTDEDNDGVIDNLPIGDGTFTLNFTGNVVNLIDNNFISFPVGNDVDGDERLYLKGGPDGNIAILNLFNGDEEGNSTELDDFKSKNWLINEANLVFYVDQALLNENGSEPDRLHIFDLEKNTTLIDYQFDGSVDADSGYQKIKHSVPLTRVDDEQSGEGIKYKIRITEHINNIFLRDSTNVKLGLAVTSNINSTENLNVKDFDESDLGDLPESITSGIFLSSKGTILYGNNIIDETKKVKLEIFYTEPN